MIEIIKIIVEIGILTVAAGLFIHNANKDAEIKRLQHEEDRKFQRQEQDKDKKDRRARELAQERKIDDLLNTIMNSKHNVNKENEINLIEKQINNLLKNLLYTSNAGRTYFVRYHNGGVDLNNISFLKMSMTNEMTRQGISSALNGFTNQFRAIFPWLIDTLSENNPIHIDELDKIMSVDHSLYEYLKSQNIIRAHAIAIRNAHGQVIGFLGISYLNNEIYHNNDKLSDILIDARNNLEVIVNI